MLCPACRAALGEHDPACPQCGFNLAAADQVFGMAPQLNPELTDLAGVLSPGDQDKVLHALRRNHRRFPQLTFACVLTRLPAQMPLPVCAFWLFNRGGFVTALEKGGACRLVLLVLDADHGRAACMIGYGLEPFVPANLVQSIADAALPALRGHDYAQALLDALDLASQELTVIAETLPQGFGLNHAESASLAEPVEAFAY